MLEDVLRQLCADLRAHIRVVQVNILVSNELEKTEGLLLPIVGRLMLASLLQVLHRVEPSLAIRQGLFNRLLHFTPQVPEHAEISRNVGVARISFVGSPASRESAALSGRTRRTDVLEQFDAGLMALSVQTVDGRRNKFQTCRICKGHRVDRTCT